MSSIRTLRAWSESHIADIREREIPPIVSQLKQDFEHASAADSAALKTFAKAYAFNDEDIARLPGIVAS